jgi:hypothetical protein
MALPEDYQQKVLQALNKKKINANCEVCAQNNWSVADQAVTLLVSNLEGGISLPPPNIPSAALVCNNCGNVRLFALSVLGLLENKEGGKK